MNAGRELDALIAETFFGWRWYEHDPNRECMQWSGMLGVRFLLPPIEFTGLFRFRTGQWYPDTRIPADESSTKVLIPQKAGWLPGYSTDIGAAWLVVEKMRETHWTEVDGIGRPDQMWRATFREMEDPEDILPWPIECNRIADTAPLAICLAALAALGVTVN